MSTKIWLEELSFGSNFGNLSAIGSNPLWCYFLVHTFQIKKFESISSNGSRDIAKSLKISFGSSFVSLCVRVEIFAVSIPSIHLSNKKTLDYLYLFLSFSVHNFCARTDGQTLFEKVLFFPPAQEYIPISIIFSNFTPYAIFFTKVSIPFFPYWK